MLIQLIRNKPRGNTIKGRLVINGRWFCNTLERVGYAIPALCYPMRVTQSSKHRRLLPVVQNVPCSPIANRQSPIANSQSPIANSQSPIARRGTPPQHYAGCILLPDRETEDKLTKLLLDTQVQEEIILEVFDFRPGTAYGYDTPCPLSECASEREARCAQFARRVRSDKVMR